MNSNAVAAVTDMESARAFAVWWIAGLSAHYDDAIDDIADIELTIPEADDRRWLHEQWTRMWEIYSESDADIWDVAEAVLPLDASRTEVPR